MKKILIPAVLILVAAFFTACNPDRLEIPRKGVVYTQDFYNTDEDCEAALVAAYRGLIANVCSEEGGSIYAPASTSRATICMPPVPTTVTTTSCVK